jgi:hypothetical protein
LEIVREQLKTKVNNIVNKLERKFEESFSLDANQLPRRWDATDDISALCTEARKKALKLLDTYVLLRLDPTLDEITYAELTGDSPPKVESSLIAITPTRGDG